MQQVFGNIKTLLNEGYDIDFELVKEKSKDSEAIYKQHLMSCLIDAHYTDEYIFRAL